VHTIQITENVDRLIMTRMYIQGPVGRGRIPIKYFWLPCDMMLRGGANTLGILQMGSNAVLGAEHRHLER
jgi:hypothetical protein